MKKFIYASIVFVLLVSILIYGLSNNAEPVKATPQNYFEIIKNN